MKKTISILAILLVTLAFAVPTAFAATPSLQVTGYRVNAKGGVLGPPSDNPKPPNGEEPPAIEYELFIEIDYMLGHEPNATILEYVHEYYLELGINVTFYADVYDENGVLLKNVPESDLVPFDASTTDEEFWDIEGRYNNNDHGFYSKWKWVLYGAVDGEYGAMGYTWILMNAINPKKADMVAGNYIFIADGDTDDWASDNILEPYGGEAVVLMHEIGHSIGIGVVEWNVFYGWVEVYDRDTYSVMSYLSVNNAGYYDQWYYSGKYWNTKNMEYYTT